MKKHINFNSSFLLLVFCLPIISCSKAEVDPIIGNWKMIESHDPLSPLAEVHEHRDILSLKDNDNWKWIHWGYSFGENLEKSEQMVKSSTGGRYVLKGDVLALFDKDMVPWLGYSYEINNRGMKLYAIDKDFKREKLLYVFMKL